MANIDSKRLPKSKDRRVKVPKSEYKNIKRLYKKEGMSYSKIATLYQVSKTLIMFIVKPETKERAVSQFKERRKDGRYYDKERNRLAIKSLRDYKRELFKTTKSKKS